MLKIYKRILALLTLLFATVSIGCNSTSANQGGYNVTTQEALTLWKNKEAIIIDVRTPAEYNEGHIPDVLSIPLNELEKRIDEVPSDKKVLLICRSGSRSARGTSLLQSKGFDDVHNISGGMQAWQGPVKK